MSLDLFVCDVGHGDAIIIKFPSGKVALIDCGGKDTKSASVYLEALKIKKLDYLAISHPHVDHIRDIINVNSKFYPAVLGRNKIFTKEKIKDENADVFDTHEDIINKYLEMNTDFSESVSGDPEKDPTMPEWGNVANIVSFSNNDPNMNLNNLSRALFVKHDSHVILCPGDLEEKGWLKLLENPNFVKELKKVTILIAPHHGRDSGFCNEIFQHFTPQVTIVSDGRFGDTSATDRYCAVTNDAGITLSKPDGQKENRKVLSTRNDGLIFVAIMDDGDLLISSNG